MRVCIKAICTIFLLQLCSSNSLHSKPTSEITGSRSHLIKENITYPDYVFVQHEGPGVIDVTQPPYNVDNTGREDVTETLVQIYNDIWLAHIKEKEIYRVRNEEGGYTWVGHGPARIMYFPEGVYKVSGPIEYTVDRGQRRGTQKNKIIHFQGQSTENTIIRLIDNAPRFQDLENPLPVVSFIKKGTHSNIAFMNTISHMTIDIGQGNPGASALRYHDNNCGSVRFVKLMSSDPNYRGSIGLDLTGGKTGLGYIKDLEIIGFDIGILIKSWGIGHTIEHLTLKHQNQVGIQVDNNQLTIRNILSINKVPVMNIVGIDGEQGSGRAFAVMVDGHLSGGSKNNTAIDNQNGFLFARNITTRGYESAIINLGQEIKTEIIDEFVSHPALTLTDPRAKSLNLKIENAPDIPWDPFDRWANVQAYGAVPDDGKDDAEAIQKAVDSGKSTVIFPVGVYHIENPIIIRKNVRRFNFLWSRMRPNPEKFDLNQSVFVIEDGTHLAVLIENFSYGSSGDFYWFDQATDRTVIYRDMFMGGDGAAIKNSVTGGRAFLEMIHGKIHIPNLPVFHFREMDVWMRSLNPEGSNTIKMLNEGGNVWILGFKIEAGGTDFYTRDGGQTEILGGTLNRYGGGKRDKPAIINDNSNVSIVACETGRRHSQIIIREIKDDQIKDLTRDQFPVRGTDIYNALVIPLYSGRLK